MERPRLGINIDHIATLRQLRKTPYPDLLTAAELAIRAGAELITVHLREDRRHIQDADVIALKKNLKCPLNLEIAAQDKMLRFALRIRPDWVCLVPEKRQEVTTEGGLDLKKHRARLKRAVSELQKKKIKVSLFIEPSLSAIRLAAEIGADAVELHTGRYCIETQRAKKNRKAIDREKNRIFDAAVLAHRSGLSVHAGHGLDYSNIRTLCEWTDADRKPLIREYNIGHAIVCRSALVGLDRAVKEMVSAIWAP